jgi:RcsF lipoprotein
MSTVLLAVTLFVGGGCAPFFEHIKIDPATVDTLRLQTPVYTESDIKGRDYMVIQPVQATSCKGKMWDPSPTAEDATDQLRVKAARLGANGVLNVTCEAPRGSVSLNTNCWSSLTCHGAAIRVNR